MGVIPVSLWLGWVRGQIGDLQLQADDWLPTQREQGCRPIRIPGGSDLMHSKIRTPRPASRPTPTPTPAPPPGMLPLPYSRTSPPTHSVSRAPRTLV